MLACNGLKICSCCGVELSLDMFHKAKKNEDGLHCQCKICRALNIKKKDRIRNRRNSRIYRKKHPVRNRIKRRIWFEKHPGYMSRATARYKKIHRKQHNVETMARRYLKKGKIKRRSSCEDCRGPSSMMHHEDYNKPLEVIWLCRKCHGKRHRKL